ncbi:restriction endonuclease subunit S [Thermoanaerobacterium thermosaccharolyticum]|uniref:restriction endonuclease subunit S n=1 Tax=Thermoanaerobacterium thermosaccharolyticum TaxID=1517 RepID=UPI003D2D7210
MDSKFFKIGDVFNVEKGLVQSSKNVEGQFDFITASAEWKTHNEYSHDCEALVFAAGAAGSLGRTHYVNGKFIASDLCFVLTPKDNLIDKVDLKFYFYYFNLNKDTIVKSTATGTSKLAINMKNFINYCIPLPSIEYQKLGRERIEEVEPKINELDLIFEKNLTYITRLRQSILQEAVQGKLVPQDPNDEPASILLEKIKKEKERLIKEGKIKKEKPLPPIKDDEIPYELPKGWEWVRLGELCSYIQRGKSPKYSNVEEIPVVSQKCIQWNGFDISKARFIDPMSLDGYAEERFIEPLDLLWNSTGLGTLGRINVYPKIKLYDKVVADSHVTVIRPFKNFIYSKYLYLWFSGPIVQGEINDKSTGSTKQAELNTTTVKEYIVPLPPINEQKRIVEKVEQFMALCDELEKNIEQCKKDSELLMQSVLQEAFKEK